MSKGHFILYNSNEKNFTSMGALVLDNYIMNTCIKETMNENYTFEFEMFNSVAHLVGPRMYIKAPTRKGDELFRVRIIEKDMNNYGATYFYCTQVFFCDMEDNFIENLELLNVTGYAALNSMDTSTQYPHKFTFYSDISKVNSTIILRKNFVSALIGDSEYSFVNTWGGELEVNKFSVKMMSKIGQDRGVRIRYRKNLTGLNAKTDYSTYCTRIMPIGYDDITIPEKYVDSEKIDPNHPIVRVVEFSNIKVKANEEDEEGFATIEEAENALREVARMLFTEGKVDEPESTYEIEFQELSSTIEYHDDYAVLENIFLGDTVEVYHEDLDISVSTRCVSYEYDPKTDRYISITLGNVISKFTSSSIKNQETIIDKIESNEKDYQGKLDDAVEKLTNMINTGLTGHVVITDNEIMIMDTTDKDTAVEVWRYNINGFGYSNTGYNGPFIGLTKDGKLLVTEATTNKFTAALINAGILQSVDGTSWFNLDSGTFSWANGAIAYDGTNLTIKVGDQNINDLLDATFNVLVNHEHQIIQLDSNYFPVNNGSYEFTFTVLKENSTVETPCLVTGVTPNVAVDGISFKMKDNKCTMVVDKTKRLLNVKESFFDVTLEVLDYTLTKRLTWSVSVNGRDGEDGVNGTPGINGKDGVNSYFHIKYSDVPNPTSSSQMTETPSYYIGIYTDSIKTDSDDPTKYTWSRFRGIDGNNGKDGLPGIDGKDGTTYYYHVKYSDDGRTFTADDGETPGKYLGILIDTTKEDSLVFNAYTWKKIEGDAGANASYVRISNNGQVFLKGKAATSFKPTSITLTPIFTNATYSNWQYSVDNTSTWNTVTSGQNGLTISGNNLIVASTSALFTSTVKSILFKVNCTNGVSDTITLVRIEEGKDGVNGVNGSNGTNGADGKGIKAIANYYLASASSSKVTTSTSGWTTTVQNISTSKKYLWNYELITYTDNSTYTTTPTIIGVHGTNGTDGTDGTNGTDGKGIKSITEYYVLSTTNSGVTTDTTGWSTKVPTLTATKKYLWNYEEITYTDNSTTSTTPAIIGVYGDKGADGADGKDGKGINSVTNYYLASESSSGVTTSTSGWTETIQTISTSKKYLWNYEKITYTDNTTYSTSPMIIGVHGTNGTNGKGIKSITEYYVLSTTNSGVTTDTTGWSTKVPTLTATKKYLWNYEKITYTNNSTTSTTPAIIGVYGDKGADGVNGKDGKGVNAITNYYLASSSSSGVTTSTSGWTEAIQTISTSKKYLWNYEVIAYTDGTNTTTTPTIIGVHGTNGTNGSNGADGKGIKSITEYYLATASSSGVTASTSGWTTTVQSMTSTKKYLWNYEVIKYTDNSTTTGSPKIIGVYGDKGTTGASAINILLSNESHTFAASSNGAAIAANITTNVLCYKGSILTACKVGTISGLPTGMTATINDNSTTGPSITIAVATSLTTKAGTVTIPVTCGSVTVNKIFSYSLAVAGANGTNGTNGTNAKLIKINASTNVFKSTDGGVTFSPSSISLTSAVQNVSFSKWQYSSNGSSFTNVTSGKHGLTVNDSTLVVSATSDLFTDTVTTLAIRAVSSTSTVYDTMTLYKLYDRTDINDKFEEMTLTVTQSNEKWEAAFKNSNANNMFLNSDFMTGTSDDWIDNGGGISIGTASTFPFYGNTEYYLRTSFPRGVRYDHDVQLEPNTDYVYEGYIYVNAALTGTNATPLNFWIWTGDTPTSTRLATIVDYRQTLTKGRFVKCYVHFKTDNVTEALYGRFFVYHSGTASGVGVKRMSLKKGTVESTWTQHPNEVKSIVTSIDKDGVKVKHSESGTYTQMDSTGFSIRDSETGDVFTWLSSKEQWTELKVDKVFANNLENIYEGPGHLYIDHSAKLAGDGSADKPFNSFKQLAEYLQATPVINKDVYITVRDPGFIINEQLRLDRLKGSGFIKITLEGTLVMANVGSGQYCIRLHQIPKWVWIVSGREFGSSTTGAVLQDGGNGDGHGIYATDVDRLEIDALTIACKNWGIHTERTHLYTWHLDFGKCYCAVELEYQSIYYSSDDVGSCVDFCRIKSGSFAYWGYDGGTPHRPKGDVRRINGMYYDGGLSLTPTASPRYSSSNPSFPTGQQVYTYTYDWTSHRTYAYQYSNWSDSDCKQGSWGYGLRGGHMFFDISAIRRDMTGTLQDGNTITLTRASSGGISGGANVYINGSTCSSASGTPSYSVQILLGTLAWGETKTFTLPKAIVQGLINGSYNSLAVYVNNTASNCYLNIVNASITLKTKK